MMPLSGPHLTPEMRGERRDGHPVGRGHARRGRERTPAQPRARPSDPRDELAVVIADLGFETAADLARERGTLAARGHRDLEIAAAEHGRQDEVAGGRTID